MHNYNKDKKIALENKYVLLSSAVNAALIAPISSLLWDVADERKF